MVLFELYTLYSIWPDTGGTTESQVHSIPLLYFALHLRPISQSFSICMFEYEQSDVPSRKVRMDIVLCNKFSFVHSTRNTII